MPTRKVPRRVPAPRIYATLLHSRAFGVEAGLNFVLHFRIPNTDQMREWRKLVGRSVKLNAHLKCHLRPSHSHLDGCGDQWINVIKYAE